MADAYGIIGTAVRPVVTTEAEWIVCPASTEYIGTVRITNQHSASVDVSLAHTAGSGAATGEDWDLYEYELAVGI